MINSEMKIIVLIKQVPMAWAMTLDPETRTLKRNDVRLEVSSFDIRPLPASLANMGRAATLGRPYTVSPI